MARVHLNPTVTFPSVQFARRQRKCFTRGKEIKLFTRGTSSGRSYDRPAKSLLRKGWTSKSHWVHWVECVMFPKGLSWTFHLLSLSPPCEGQRQTLHPERGHQSDYQMRCQRSLLVVSVLVCLNLFIAWNLFKSCLFLTGFYFGSCNVNLKHTD